VVGAPAGFVREVGGEEREEGGVEGDFAAFQPLPGAVWGRGGDAVVDVAEGDVVRFLVVKDGLEGGDDLVGGWGE
jgi:hypothetical protein